jgi:hypothetical protein
MQQTRPVGQHVPPQQLLLQQVPLPVHPAKSGNLHMPPQQTRPPVHVAPPLPQRRFVLPGWHTLFWQHPEQPLLVLQTHVPLLHVVPAGHVTHVAPPAPQCWLLLVWQFPVASQHPFGQVAAVQTLTQVPL